MRQSDESDDEPFSDESSDDLPDIVLDLEHPCEEVGVVGERRSLAAQKSPAEPTPKRRAIAMSWSKDRVSVRKGAASDIDVWTWIKKDDPRPWTQPNADPSDWFNYGFDEKSWTQYVSKQRDMVNDDSRQRFLSHRAERRSGRSARARTRRKGNYVPSRGRW